MFLGALLMTTKPPTKSSVPILMTVNRLFPEVLLEIFMRCLPAEQLPRPGPKDMPLLFGSVCRTWRDVAWNNPRLWTGLALSTVDLQKIDIESLQRWLGRSGSSPLEICIGVKDNTWKSTDKFNPAESWAHRAGEIVDVLMPFSNRLKTLGVTATIQSAMEITRLLANGTPLLGKLSIKIGPRVGNKDPLVLDLSSSTQLRSLLISGAKIKPFHHDVVFQHIRKLSLDSFRESSLSMDEWLTLLGNCPHIEKFKFALDNNKPLTPSDVHHTCYSLTEFRLQTDRKSIDPGPALDRLTLPALCKLEISIEGARKLDSWPHIALLLNRSDSPLTDLKIKGTPMKHGDFLNCLHNAPRLRNLSVFKIPFPSEIIQAMNPRNAVEKNTDCLCPDLEGIYISHCDDFHWDWNLGAMVESRWESSRKEPAWNYGRTFDFGRHKLQPLRQVTIVNSGGTSGYGMDRGNFYDENLQFKSIRYDW
ncbi:hypothetical protein BD410DRAFT_783816 [Rickenella mellea]|uniref:Uncharacterized protein n=1 Tax=Rickenella mellea TaxID=50990 RepID=A0A4Y7QG91_9AGAM|nr:hypothetical protein BD410DRAFT_783816 [Rickenella mellea]